MLDQKSVFTGETVARLPLGETLYQTTKGVLIVFHLSTLFLNNNWYLDLETTFLLLFKIGVSLGTGVSPTFQGHV